MIDPNMPKSNVMKEEFNWEIPIENVPLPSQGLIYSPDTKLFNAEMLKIKSMTAREEDILSSPAYIKDGIAVQKVIESCLIDKGINVQDMILGDRNALMISIRITGYGSSYDVLHNCRNCSANNEVHVGLDELEINRMKIQPVSQGKNLFEFKLPVTGKTIQFKFLTGHDDKEQSIKSKRMESLGMP